MPPTGAVVAQGRSSQDCKTLQKGIMLPKPKIAFLGYSIVASTRKYFRWSSQEGERQKAKGPRRHLLAATFLR